MQIDPIQHLPNLELPDSKKVRNSSPEDAKVDDPLELSALARHRALVNKLTEMPELRPDIVEHGKLLVADSNYPSEKILDDLAQIIASSSKKDIEPGL